MNAQPEIHRLRLRAIVGNLVTSMNFHRDVLNVHEITAVSAASSNLLQVANPLKLNRQGEKRPGAGPVFIAASRTRLQPGARLALAFSDSAASEVTATSTLIPR